MNGGSVLLIIQSISLIWRKQARGSNFAKVRHQFRMAYPIYNAVHDEQVVVYPFEFVQTEQGIITYEELTQQQLEKYLPTLGFTSSQVERVILRELSRFRKFEAYSSIQELNLTNLSVSSIQNGFEVSFYYDRFRSGLPFRRGHNKDYCNRQSRLYGQDCLNEIAFILKENQYGRIVWNERKKEVDTGVWYYKILVYNLFSTISSNFKYDIFMSRTPDYEYKQLATLY